MEAVAYFEISYYYKTQIPVRIELLPAAPRKPEARAIKDIKLDFAAVTSGTNREFLIDLERQDKAAYDKTLRKATIARQYALNVARFVTILGGKGALLVWPCVGAYDIVRHPLHRLDQAFVRGMTTMMQALPAYIAIRRIIAAVNEMPIGDAMTPEIIEVYDAHNDVSTIGRGEALSESAITATLSIMDLGSNVMVASPSGYGRLYGIDSILCSTAYSARQHTLPDSILCPTARIEPGKRFELPEV
ncbi:hypothetical protein VE03_03515 [Pseudogymnoascus sp. 23342-1-I1]|nr:hypothetical protein VE03_03515 [Pseudogymnoascus sp. 23342-1-I1]